MQNLSKIILILCIPIIFWECNQRSRDNRELRLMREELELKQKELELKTKELEIISLSKENIGADNIVTDLFEKYNRSVFKIFSLDNSNELLGTGTGFFIGNKGYAISNYHVLGTAYKAYIELIDGRIINVDFNQIYAASENNDYIIFKVNSSNIYGFEDYSGMPVKNGETVFTIGNPAGGLSNSISKGIITGQNWFDYQFSAPIDHGSSGSPLFNLEGKLIGLVWGGKHEGNIYRAKKIKLLDLSRYINHDSSLDHESMDPNTEVAFNGEYIASNIIWSMGESPEEAYEKMKVSNYVPAQIGIDGNGAGCWVEKYHDARFGQVEISIFDVDSESSLFRIKIQGREVETNEVIFHDLNTDDGVIRKIVRLYNDKYISLMTQIDIQLLRDYHLIERSTSRIKEADRSRLNEKGIANGSRVTSRTNMRSEPSPISDVIISIPKDSKVELLSNEKGYWKCKYNDHIGYINEVFFH